MERPSHHLRDKGRDRSTCVRDTQHKPRRSNAKESSRSEDKGYIRTWLKQIQQPPIEASHRNEIDDRVQPWRPHNLPIPTSNPNLVQKSRQRQAPRIENESTPSSPSRDGCDQRSMETVCEPIDQDPDLRDDSVVFAASETDDDSHGPGKNVYEKRPRRKTREDRYDSRKQRKKRAKPEADHKKEPSPVKKSRNKSKQKLRSGKEVMTNFTSTAIPPGRVTIKPNLTTGLFRNARVSKSSDMTDLDFNAMGFLVRGHFFTEEQEHCVNSREKDQRRHERDNRDQSDFFDRVPAVRKRMAEPCTASVETRDGHQLDTYRTPTKLCRVETRTSESLSRQRATECRRALSLSDEELTSPMLRSFLRDNHSETTYVSWSPSPERKPTRARADNDDIAELKVPLPIAALKDLIETGVFDFARVPDKGVTTRQLAHRRDIKNTEFVVSKGKSKTADNNASEPVQMEDKGVMVNSPPSLAGSQILARSSDQVAQKETRVFASVPSNNCHDYAEKRSASTVELSATSKEAQTGQPIPENRLETIPELGYLQGSRHMPEDKIGQCFHDSQIFGGVGSELPAPLINKYYMANQSIPQDPHVYDELDRSSHEGRWLGYGHVYAYRNPHLPQVFPSMEQISQENSVSHRLGQSWNLHPSDFYFDDNSQGYGIDLQEQIARPATDSSCYERHDETMQEFIERIESETLGRVDDGGSVQRMQNAGAETMMGQILAPTSDDIYQDNKDIRNVLSRHDPISWPMNEYGQTRGSFENQDPLRYGYGSAQIFEFDEMAAFWRPNRFL